MSVTKKPKKSTTSKDEPREPNFKIMNLLEVTKLLQGKYKGKYIRLINFSKGAVAAASPEMIDELSDLLKTEFAAIQTYLKESRRQLSKKKVAA